MEDGQEHSEEHPVAGRYELGARLGRGGMGEVFRVRDQSTGDEVALKRIRGAKALTRAARTSFRREFHVMAGLRHPHIVRVHDYGVDPDGPYYTMELLDGRDLRELGPMPWVEACGVLREVASALTFLHSRRLLHRDLAPRNIRCTEAGQAKLIDFGVLATFGTADNIAGTPPLIAPEGLRGLPIDQRADLFSFGGLAYWLLTGTHAYPARGLKDLEKAWRSPVAPPSASGRHVPPALDDLVMALLCLDPLGRPRSAVEVVDRLSAIADLPPLGTDVVREFLASAPLVGRRMETRSIRARADGAVRGSGYVFLIGAPSGGGKSRLLRESVFEAQLAGAAVVSVDCGVAGRGPYAAFREIARGLLKAVPEEAAEAAKGIAFLSEVVPELSASTKAMAPYARADDADISDPAEIRLRVQAALNTWVSKVCRARPLALLVDDVQRCDEASIAVLAGLSRSARDEPLLMVVALRTDETPRFPAAVASLADAGELIRLRGLTYDEIEELLRTVFGEVPRTAYLARWMHDTTGGSPLHVTELCRHVVNEGIVTHHDGMWVLPGQFAEKQVPADLRSALDARIAPLSPDARALGEAAAVHGGELNLVLALALAEPSEGGADGGESEDVVDSQQRVFSAIDELVRLELFVGAGERYRFRHDGLREALLRGIDDARRQVLHLRVAQALEREMGDDPEQEVEIGWHFHHGGDPLRGAVLLERAGRGLFEAQAMGDAIGPVETALETYRAAGAAPTAHLDLQFILIVAGALSDRDAALRHVSTTLTAYQQQSGVAHAVRWGRFVGRHVGLLLGVGTAMVRWFLTPKAKRGLSPMVAVTRYMLTIGHASYVYFATNDVAGFRTLLRWMAPMNAFRGLGPHGAYNGQLGMLDILLGRLGDAKRRLTIAADSIMVDRITPTTEFERRLIEAASRGFVVLAGVFQLDPDVDKELARIEELDLRYFDFGARTAKAIRYRLNGFEEEAVAITTEQETTALQLGAGWHLEAMLITYSSLAYALCRDILGLKRCVEELGRLVEAGFAFRPQLMWASGEYHRERGELDDADECLAAALEALDPEEGTIRQWTVAAQAEVALARGDNTKALELARAGLDLGEDPVLGQVLPRLKVTRVLALAEAAAGDPQRATRRLVEALAEAEALGNPPLRALLHEAAARVALSEGNKTAYDHHRVEVFRAVESTRNPALIASAGRLRDLAQAMRPEHEHNTETLRGATMTLTTPEVQGSMLSGCRGPAERATRALELALASSTGETGFLYVMRGDALVLAAPAHGDAPSEVEAAATAVLRSQGRTERGPTAQDPDAETISAGDVSPGEWAVAELAIEEETNVRAVGALVIRRGTLRYRPPAGWLLSRLAVELHEAGDATARPVLE